MNINEFYPSINQATLDNALLFAQGHIQITDDDLRLIKHCRKSLHFNNEKHGKQSYLIAHSMSLWRAIMAPRFVNLSEHKLHKIFNKNTLKVSYSCSKI